MRKLINYILKKSGYAIYASGSINYLPTGEIMKKENLSEIDVARLKGKLDGGLKKKLMEEGKTRWLEIGCGNNFEENFFYVDTFPEEDAINKDRYFRMDFVSTKDVQLEKMGKFDFIRMQHVFEHFTPEDGLKVLENCSKILNNDGYILITTPDLRRYVHLYLSGKIRDDFEWAHNRIDINAPNSFYFSIFSHSILSQKHEWCYDVEGIIYQLEKTGKFKNIKEVKIEDQLANIPFTHNRPNEDVCVIANKK